MQTINTNSTEVTGSTIVPTGAKIIAILFYIASVAFIVLGIISSFVSSINLQLLGIGLGLLAGIASIVWGVLNFIAGRGLWSGQQWGKILAIAMSSLYVIFGIINVIETHRANYFSLIVNIVIILYLLISRKVSVAYQSGKLLGISITFVVLAIIAYSIIQYPTITAPVETTIPALSNTNASLVILTGTAATLPVGATDLGIVAPSTTEDLVLALKQTSEEQAAEQNMLAQIQDPSSPNYHKYSTSEENAAKFGLSDQELQTVTSWLSENGFTKISVFSSKNFINFSGSALQVQNAFHVQIHNYMKTDGEQCYANPANERIPTSLAPLVSGIVSLSNCTPRVAS